MTDFVSKVPPPPKNDIPLSYSFVVNYVTWDNVIKTDCVMFNERQAHAYCEYMNSKDPADPWRWDYVPAVNRIFPVEGFDA